MKKLIYLSLSAFLCLQIHNPVIADVQNVQEKRTVEVRGEGKNAKEALADAEIAAVLTPISRLVQTSTEKQKWDAYRKTFLLNRKKYLKRLRIIGKGTSDSGRFYKIRFQVDEAKIRQALVEAGVIQSTAALNEAIDFPKIAAYYIDPRDNSDYAKWSVERINNYLLNKKFRIVDPKLWEKLAKEDDILSQSQGSPSRLGQIMALRSSADVYLEVEINPKIVGRSGDFTYVQTPVTIRAYESSSGEAFITKVYQRLNAQNKPEALAMKGSVDVSAKIVVEEAVAGVMPEVFADLSRHWKASLVQGKQYRLVFKKASKEQLLACKNFVKGMVKEMKLLPDNSLLIRTPHPLADIADKIEEELGDAQGLSLEAFDLGNAYFIFD